MTSIHQTILVGIAALMLCIGCKREERGFRVQPPAASASEGVDTSDLHPGSITSLPPTTIPSASTKPTARPATWPTTRVSKSATLPVIPANFSSPPTMMLPVSEPAGGIHNAYEENAYALSEGKRLFNAINCSGCHAHGGGGMGPPLMDDKWIYGSESSQVFATIVQGRPNGMPSFRGKIPDYQVWQLSAYVRSMSGLVPQSAAPGREDHMQNKPPENSIDPQKPVTSREPS